MPKKLPKRPGGATDFRNDGPITEMGQHQVSLLMVFVAEPTVQLHDKRLLSNRIPPRCK